MQVTIARLTKRYGRATPALNEVDLTIPTGMFGLLGPNGAGKTTLMRILSGILRPTSGTVWVGGHDATTESGRQAVKHRLGYLPQELGLYPDLTAWEFLDYIGILKGLADRDARRRRVNELLETVGLADVAERKLKGFSGGMKRRVGIAQALLNDPRLLIVDEPTAGLDPEERIRFRNILAALAGDRTVILSTHIVEDVAQTCRNLAVLAGGRVLFSGTTAGLVDAARGQVWTIEANEPIALPGSTVVSTLHLGDTMQFRIVGDHHGTPLAMPAVPTLEDGYVSLMQRLRAPAA
jgi:ABC-type multidrug transport system ATPase subunit